MKRKGSVMAKIVLIGQAPSKNGDPRTPLEGRIGKRLAALCGMPYEDYLVAFDRRNVLQDWSGKSGLAGSADAFPLSLARKAAMKMAPRLYGRTVILMGKLTAAAFELEETEFFKWHYDRTGEIRFAVFPHPSGLNRFWNDAKNTSRASAFLKRSLWSS